MRIVDLINKRYTVLKSIKQNRFVSSYLALDEKIGSKEVQLNIINSEYLPENLLNYFINEYQTFAIINSEKHIKLYDFDIIKFLDNKVLEKRQYFYTNEIVEDDSNFIEAIGKLNEGEQLDLIINLCQGINYLHLRGFVYGDININNIIVTNSNFKFKDIITKELNKINFWDTKDNLLIFKSPEVLEGKSPSVLSDIYSLGVLLAFICRRGMINNLIEINDEIGKCKINDKNLLCKLAPVIEKMTESNEANRYTNILEIIKDINFIFNKDYKALVKEEIEKINLNNKLIGRDYEVNNILKLYNSMTKLELSDKLVVVHGEYGIGKTKLLNEVERLMRLNSINVYSSYSQESSENQENKGFFEIIKKLTGECDSEILERYEGELVKFIPELAKDKEVIPYEALDAEKEKYRVISSICDFIHDITKGKPMVFIIDNIHRVNNISIEILKYLSLRRRNLMLLVSYCDGEYSNNSRLSDFLAELTGKSNMIDIQLHGLSNEDSITMIQDMLRMHKRAKNFATRIFLNTYGNPMFIVETLKNLLANKYIYLNEETARWESDSNDYTKLPMPTNLEQAILTQIKDIEHISFEILKSLSIFNSGISEEVIYNIIGADKKSIEERLTNLEAKGIVCRKIEDSGFVYDFTNRILKNIINGRLDEKYRISMHEAAATLLEKKYEEGIENREELIYHLEKSGQKEKTIKYCLENADKMEAFKNRSEVIRNLKKVLSMLIDEKDEIRKVEILLRIGNSYEMEGSKSEAIEYFEEAERLASNEKAYKYQIDALNKMAEVYYLKNQLNKTESYIDRSENILFKSCNVDKYLEGYLQCMELKVRVMYSRQEYNKAAELCISSINLCGDNYYKLKGLFSKNLGNVYLATSKIKEAVDCYKRGSDYFENANYSEGVVNCMNNLAVAYGDYYQDNEMAINYFTEMKDISERNHIIIYEIIALTNLASSYCYEFEYEAALQYFLESLKKSKKVDYESNIFYCYIYLSFVYLKLEDYLEAYKYYRLAEKELEDHPEQGKEIGTYYQKSAELFYALGDKDKAREFLEKAHNLFKEEDSLAKWDCEVLAEYLILNDLTSSDEIRESINKIKALIKNYKSENIRKSTLYDTAIMLYDKNLCNEANEMFLYEAECSSDTLPDLLQIKKDYLKAILIESGQKELLEAVISRCSGDKNKKIYWNVCCLLGDYYMTEKNYFQAINLYYEAAELIRKLTMQLPASKRVQFVYYNRMAKPFEKIKLFMKHKDYCELSEIEGEKFNLASINELNGMFNSENINNILHYKHFIRSARKFYNSELPADIKNTNGLIKNLSSNPIKNLDIIAKYIAGVTLATRSVIIVDGYEKSYYAISSNDGTDTLPCNKLIFDKVKAAREPMIIKQDSLDYSCSEINIMLQGLKAVMCIPIIMRSEDNLLLNDLIKGYIYLESDRVLNNFNKESLMKCSAFSRLAGINIERYQLQIVSSTDKLTGTLTRKSLEDALSEAIDKAEASGGIFSVLMMDMDHFKDINDRYGHQTGDEVLKKACSIIKANLNKEAVFGRYGGEEFIILLPGADSKSAFLLAEDLRIKVNNAKILGEKAAITVSIGISTFPHNAEWKEELIEKADQALYISKESGRNRCKVWSSKFGSKGKVRNKLSGIVSGNMVQDSRNVLVMVDIIELIKQNSSIEDKIYNILGRVIEITESEYGCFFTIKEGKIKKVYSRKNFNEGWTDNNIYNVEIISSILAKKQGVYMTDWDESNNRVLQDEMPSWNSIVAVPLIRNEEIKGVLYLSVPINKKEFKFDEFNYVNTLGELAAAIL